MITKDCFVLSVFIPGSSKPVDREYHYTLKAAEWAKEKKTEQAARNGWNVRIAIEQKTATI